MLGLRFTSDAQKRSKNGQPPHRTTGEARTNSIQCRAAPESDSPNLSPNMPSRKTGAVNIVLMQNRFRMETYSESGASSAVVAAKSIASSAMPHFGHAPGP